METASRVHEPHSGDKPYKFRPRIPYPRMSWLSHDEQVKYLDLFEKYSNYVPVKATTEETKEINMLKVQWHCLI